MPVPEGEWEDEVVVPPVAFTNVEPTSSGHPSSDAPGDTDPHRDVDAIGSEPTEPEPLPEFDPKVRQDFEGLLYLGKLEHGFNWMGHRFVIKTLTTGDILEVALVHKPYVNTLGDTKAYQAAVVAACVVTVDGRPMPLPITNTAEDTVLRARFDYVLRSWFPPILDVVYEQYLLLETRVDEVIAAMGKAHGWTGSIRTSNGTSV